MKEIKLKQIALENWRAQNRVVKFNDTMTEITGRNKSGKSTVFNAWLWLLLGVDENDNQNYKIFNETLELSHENSVPASVEASIVIDGIDYTLKKVAKQGWVRKRGSDVYEKKNTDDYEFYIDSIKRTSTEYKSFVEENFAPYDKLKMITNIRHFLSMDWKELRKVFQDMVGEIKPEDFSGDYSLIASELAKYNTEEIKESIRSNSKPIKAEINSLPKTIETLQENLPDISNLDSVQKEIEDAKEQISDIDKRLLGDSENIQKIISKRDSELSAINEMKKDFQKAKSEYELKPIEEANRIKAEILEIESSNEQAKKNNNNRLQRIEDAKRGLVSAKNKLETYEEYRQVLLKENKELKEMDFKGEICSFCGQPLTGDKLEEAKRKFFEKRDAKRASVVATGKANNDDIKLVKEQIEQLEKIIAEGYTEKPLVDTSKLKAKLAYLRDNFTPYKETIEGKEKLTRISNAEANLTDIPPHDTSALQNMKKSLMDDIELLSKKLGLKDEYEKQVGKIKEYQQSLKENARELALLEGKASKVTEYERERANIISNRVNGRFKYIHVEMQEVNKSGEWVDTCKITDNNGVSSSVTNAASKVLCGIDLSLALQDFFKVRIPIFVDESHTIDCLPSIDNQVVKMWNNGKDFNVE